MDEQEEAFDKFYFGEGPGTFNKYGKRILRDKDAIKEIRESGEYMNMRLAWLVSARAYINSDAFKQVMETARKVAHEHGYDEGYGQGLEDNAQES